MNEGSASPKPAGFRQTPGFRALLWQLLVLGLLLLTSIVLVHNLLGNLQQKSIRTGFGFLWQVAGFNIGESLLVFEGQATYGLALAVGLLNTLLVTGVAVVLSTGLGGIIGIGRLSQNPLIASLATGYVELVRNVPLLLQLYVWYAALTQLLPPEAGAAPILPGLYLTKGGVRYPVLPEGGGIVLAAAAAGLTLAFAYRVIVSRRQSRTGRLPQLAPAVFLVLLPPMCAFGAVAVQVGFDMPSATRFGLKGGGSLTPELTALVFGLAIYHAAFIAEIVRGGVMAVPLGQKEAAAALGIRPALTLRLVVIPQALKVILPPLSGQYLSLAKNTSLAIAIGYPDLMSIGNTIINQTGQAVEVICIVVGVYLFISLALSAVMNWYNAKSREIQH